MRRSLRPDRLHSSRLLRRPCPGPPCGNSCRSGAGAPRGFTLVEVIVVLILVGILAVVTTTIIVQPVEGFLDQSRRAELVDAGEGALQRMARDVRRALPNSVRVEGNSLEMLNTRTGMRYRDGPGPPPVGGDPDRRLEFDRADDAFNVMGPVAPQLEADDRLVIYHLGQSDADAYAGDAVITPDGTSLSVDPDPDVDDEYRITLDPAHQFRLESPRQRLHVVDRAVAYRCDPDAEGGTLRRMAGYDFGSELPDDFSGAALISGHVTDCSFDYDPGTATRNAVVTLRLELSSDDERIRLVRQVHVENAP